MEINKMLNTKKKQEEERLNREWAEAGLYEIKDLAQEIVDSLNTVDIEMISKSVLNNTCYQTDCLVENIISSKDAIQDCALSSNTFKQLKNKWNREMREQLN